MKRLVSLSWGASILRAPRGFLHHPRATLAMMYPTQDLSSLSHGIPSVCRQEKCVICQTSWVKRVKKNPHLLNFSTFSVSRLLGLFPVCCFSKQAVIVRWADNPFCLLSQDLSITMGPGSRKEPRKPHSQKARATHTRRVRDSNTHAVSDSS